MTDKVLDKFFNHLMKCEGWDKVTNDPKDPGGLTKYGISKKAYPNEDIANLTLERAKELFRRDYWKVCSCDILPDCLSVVICDTAYNCGTVTAKKILQRSLNLVDDGIFGKKTFAAVEEISKDRKALISCISLYNVKRLEYYQSLKTWQTYGKGWANRCLDTLEFAKQFLPK